MSASPIILTDDDVDRLLDMPAAIEAVRKVFEARAQGEWVAPPRHYVAFPDAGDLVFTIGGSQGAQQLAGFRVYDTFGGSSAAHSQIVAVWDTVSAKLLGLILGERLGELRTGAIGGLAVDLMANADAAVCAVIGSGDQARTQLQAAASVRDFKEIRVYSRSLENRSAFAEAMSSNLSQTVKVATSAREAVTDADIVLLATTSTKPVISAEWLKSGVHINTVGPKALGCSEMGADIGLFSAFIASDSLEQTTAYDKPFFLAGTEAFDRIIDLSQLVTRRVPIRTDVKQITLFCSVGLAGTEVAVAAEAIRKAAMPA